VDGASPGFGLASSGLVIFTARDCRERRPSRSSQRRGPAPVVEVERVLPAPLRQLAAKHPRWGWRKAHAIARNEGTMSGADSS